MSVSVIRKAVGDMLLAFSNALEKHHHKWTKHERNVTSRVMRLLSLPPR